MTPKDCMDWADKIDSRLGPIPGADADRLAKFLRRIGGEIERDPRDPDYSREGIFILHNCWRCQNGC